MLLLTQQFVYSSLPTTSLLWLSTLLLSMPCHSVLYQGCVGSVACGCRAPHLFAAVLQQAGAGPHLLPLLADPARAAFQGLSITARHNTAFHVYPFLQVASL